MNEIQVTSSLALAMLLREELTLRHYAVALGGMYSIDPREWPEAVRYISNFSVPDGRHYFTKPAPADDVYTNVLPHRGSLQLVSTYQHLTIDPDAQAVGNVCFMTGQLKFPSERLADEHYGIVPGNYMAEALAQLLAVAAISRANLKDGHVPLLSEGLSKPAHPLRTSCREPIWGIIAYAWDVAMKRFAAAGIIGVQSTLHYAGAVTGLSYPRSRLG